MFERRLGPEHPTIGKFKINLGVLRFEQGDLAGAEAHYREGLAVLETAVGREHPDLAGGLGNLAEVLRLRGRTREAVEVATRAASLVTSRDDVEAVERADVQAELARALLAAGERARALTIMREVLGTFLAAGVVREKEARELAAWIAEQEAPGRRAQ